jgi:hypothetical protein
VAVPEEVVMGKHRVSLEFDIEIHDEASAQALAAASLTRRVQHSEARGLRPRTSDGESPEVAIHAVTQAPPAAAILIALEVLRRGAATVPWVAISDVDVRNERPVP